MSIFGNLNNVLLQENSDTTNININKITSNIDHENYSFTNEGYNFVLEYTREYNGTIKEFYKNILESGDNQEIITESFGGFFTKAKEIIKKFLAFIKKIFDKFVAKLNSIFKSEKYLLKNKDQFAKFESNDEFEFKGYEFTNLIGSDIPLANTVDAWFKDEDISSGDISARVSNPIEAIDMKYKNLTDKLEDWYDEFRGMVIGETDYPISSSEYDTELKKVFRNDSDNMSSITVDHTLVMKAYQDFAGYKDIISSIEKTKKEIENNYNKLEKALERCFKKEKDGGEIFFKFDPNIYTSNSYVQQNLGFNDLEANYHTKTEGDTQKNNALNDKIYNKIDMYMKAKVGQVQQMSTIHSMAFTAKLQAAKDCFVQNKAILYKALVKIKGHKTI